MKEIWKIFSKTILRNIVVIGQPNINSLRNKFNLLAEKIKGIINVLAISETKFDESFPVGQFWIPVHVSPFRLDRVHHGGGIMIFSRVYSSQFFFADTKPIEGLFVELNFHQRKWLLSCSYNPNKNNKNHVILM